MEEQMQKPQQVQVQKPQEEKKKKRGSFFGYLLLAVGIIWLIQVVFNVDIWLNIPWKYIFILLAIHILR